MNDERTELVEVELAIAAVNEVQVKDAVKDALVADLRPIATRLANYAEATKMVVSNQVQANEAETVCAAIQADIKTVKNQEVLTKITDGLHQLHRKFTGLRDLFVAPMEANRKAIKGKVIAWQEGERIKAEALQRKLQAEADEKARLEQERLLKKAESVKTPEKKEQYQEMAQAVIAPTVTVNIPKTGMRTQHRWKVKSIDFEIFLKALAIDNSLRGYIEIKETNLERAKSANPNITIAGVEFEQKIV